MEGDEMKLRVNRMDERKRVTMFVFTDEYNQVVYSCVANSLAWAKDLLSEQIEGSPLEIADRIAGLTAYSAELTGDVFNEVKETL
jgi:hypothetical protein